MTRGLSPSGTPEMGQLPPPVLKPEMHPASEHVGQRLFDVAADLPGHVARAEMRGHDQLVPKTIPALHQVVQVHVPELVDLLLAVTGRHKR